MGRSRVADQFDRHLALHERHEPLLAVGDRRAVVVLGVDDECRRGHLLDVGDRRQPAVAFPFLPRRAEKLVLRQALRVGRAVPAFPVGDRPARDGRRESIGRRRQPVGHEAAVAAARHADPVRVDVGILGQRRVHPAQVVLRIELAPLAACGVGECVTVAGRAARIRIQHEEPGAGQHVERPEEGVAVGAVGPAVDLQHQGILGASLIAHRLDDPAFDLAAVLDEPGQALGRHQLDVGEPRVVKRGQAPLARPVAARDERLGWSRGVGDGVGHHLAVVGGREVLDAAGAARDLPDQAALDRHLEEMRAAADPRLEPNHPLGRPGRGAGRQVPVVRQRPCGTAEATAGVEPDDLNLGLLAPRRRRQVGQKGAVGGEGDRTLRAGVRREPARLAAFPVDQVDVGRQIPVVLVVLDLVAGEVQV